jgi:hypothetical protein
MMAENSDSDNKTTEAATRLPRRKVYYSAVLHIRELTIRCRVRDLSETGALVETTIPLWSGAPCYISLPRIGDAHGHLVWTDGPRTGMHFDPPLQASQLAMLAAPVHSARVDTQRTDTAWPKSKDVAAETSRERARNAVSWLRSK